MVLKVVQSVMGVNPLGLEDSWLQRKMQNLISWYMLAEITSESQSLHILVANRSSWLRAVKPGSIDRLPWYENSLDKSIWTGSYVCRRTRLHILRALMLQTSLSNKVYPVPWTLVYTPFPTNPCITQWSTVRGNVVDGNRGWRWQCVCLGWSFPVRL